MLIEHIIEPEFLVELVKSRRNCKDFEREFTKPSPRVLGKFFKLKKFRQIAFRAQSVHAPDLEKERLYEVIKLISEHGGVDRETEYQFDLSFIQNLVRLENDYCSHKCLLKDAKDGEMLNVDVISVDNFDAGINPIPNQYIVPKIAQEISKTLSELLRLSSDITFVDPYFSTQPSVWKTFLLLLEASVNQSPVSKKSITVLFDASKSSARSCKFLLQSLLDENLDFMKEITQLTFKGIRENGLEASHNRYVITNLAGVAMGYGLLETNENETDEFSLLNEDAFALRHKQYVELQAFNIEDEISLYQEDQK